MQIGKISNNGNGSWTLPDLTAFIFRKTKIPLLHKGLDAYSKRQKSIADNIANVDTPGFRRSEVRFEEDLIKALDKNGVKGYRTHKMHIPIGRLPIEELKPEYVIPDDPSLASGLNNVNIDHEMAELAKNQIRYQGARQLIEGQFNTLKSAIRGEHVR